MSDDPEGLEPANLKFLRRLVTTLTATMIIGVIVLIGVVVIRLQAPSITFPQNIELPQGVTPTAYTQGRGWYAVVSDEDSILIFDATSGALRQTIPIQQPK
ncbi:MAG: DUF6476 family protein [Litoreibacter sp.]